MSDPHPSLAKLPALALLAAGVAWACAPSTELPDPMAGFAENRPPTIDAFTTPSIPSLTFSYFELPEVDSDDAGASGSVVTDLEPMPLSMTRAIEILLENNLNVEIQDIERRRASDLIKQNKGIFDLVVSAGWTESRDRRQQNTARPTVGTAPNQRQLNIAEIDQDSIDLPDSTTDNQNRTAGVSQLHPWGGTVQLNYEHDQTKVDPLANATVPHPDHEVEWSLRIDQPLLRNFGRDVTLANIRIAKRDRQIAYEDWRQTLMNEVSQLMRRYWDLVFAINKARVTRLSLQQAESLLEINRRKYEVGLLPSIDVLQARSQVAARRGDLLSDLQNINDIQDELKRRLRITQDHEMWNYALVPTEAPGLMNIDLDLEGCLRDAYARRPELAQIRWEMDKLRIGEKVDRNAMLPTFDYFFRYGLTGKGWNRQRAQTDAERREFHNWSTGLQFSYPLQNREARYAHRRTVKQIEQQRLRFATQVESIAEEVRNALRSVDVSRQLIDIRREATEYEAAKLAAEEKRYEAGISTSQDVLDFQEDLAQARSAYLSALVTYHQALIQLEFVRGVILEENGIAEADSGD